jgi:hypothetical protein
MTLKEQLLQELESTPEGLIFQTLTFLRFLKTHPNQDSDSAKMEQFTSTGHSLLEHLKTIGKWEGDDFEECLQAIYDNRLYSGS